jgi:THO complex subunit 2
MVETKLGESVLGDIFWVLWTEVQSHDNSYSKARLIALIKECLNSKLCSKELLMERLDAQLLEAISLCVAKNFQNNTSRFQTQRWFRQVKYNLFREESEGYSKLITDLIAFFESPPAEVSVTELSARVQSYIGYFNMDPNRVIGVILHCFERHASPIHDETALQLLRAFKRSSVCNIFGFQFKRYTESSPPPKSVFRLAALLINCGIMDLNAFYIFLSPADEEMLNENGKRLEESYQKVKNLNKIKLNSMEDDEQQSKDDSKTAHQQVIPRNSKWELLIAFLQMGDWKHAEFLFNYLKAVAPMFNPGVRDAMFEYINQIIDPLYMLIANKYRLTEARVGEVKITQEQVISLFPVLIHVGSALSEQPIIFAKLCRIMTEVVKPVSKQSDYVFSDKFESIITNVLMASLSATPSNVFLSDALWCILKNMPYSERYKMYGYWLDYLYESSPELMAVKVRVVLETRDFSKKMVNVEEKELAKMKQRELAKISLSNPCIVFNIMLETVSSFQNQINLVLEMVKYMTELCLDVISFCILRQISSPRKKMKEDGVNESEWFRNLASFAGAFYMKYPDVKFDGLLQYVIFQIHSEQPLEGLILKELISCISGIDNVEELTDRQLEGLGGGRVLRDESGTKKDSTAKLKSKQNLLTSLTIPGVTFPLFVLLSRQKSSGLYHTEVPHLRMICEMYVHFFLKKKICLQIYHMLT